MAIDQAHQLRHLAATAQAGTGRCAQTPLVVVHGGKGGVGTTTMAANLAVALARQGRRTLLVDADLDHGGAANLGCASHAASLVDVLAGRCRIEDALTPGPAGTLVLAGEWAASRGGGHSAAALARLVRDLQNLSPYCDLVIVDSGSARTELPRLLWRAAGAVICVTTPETTAIMEAYAAIKVLADDTSPAEVFTLVNYAAETAPAEQAHARIAAACEKFLARRATSAGCVPRFTEKPALDHVLILSGGSALTELDRLATKLWSQLCGNRASRKSLATQAA
jgi:flagellar biosynthesis protein FlhG